MAMEPVKGPQPEVIKQETEVEKPFSGRIDSGRYATEATEAPFSGRVDTGLFADRVVSAETVNLAALSAVPVVQSPLGGQPTEGLQLRAGRKGTNKLPSLPPATQARITARRKSHGSDPAQVANLQRVTSSPVFRNLTENQQQKVLDADAGTAAFAAELRSLLANPSFRGLNAARQQALVVGMAQHGGAEEYLRSLSNAQLLTLAESPKGPQALSALRDLMKAGGLTPAEQTQVERISAATFTPGAGLRLQGNPADRATTLHMIRREMLASPSLRGLVNTINGDAAHPVTLRVGRNQPGHFVDAFNGGGTNTLDLADLGNWPVTTPAGHPEAMTQGQNLAHVLAEARHGALGNLYGPSHRAAIQAENRYRADIGQTGSLRLPPNDTTTGPGGAVIFQFDNGYREEVNVDASGATITGIRRHNPPRSP